MQYSSTRRAVFLSRPNRFIANVLIEGREAVCHVKNTGRCRELLIPGCTVIVQDRPSPGRKTAYDLIAVYKGGRLINMDSAAPNAVAGEWLRAGGPGFVPEAIRPEFRHGDSRFDFYFERGGALCLMEVKGVTLEENGVVRFPDAPTQRGVKHLHGLIRALGEGFCCYALFVVQMSPVRCLEPNRATHPQFAEALRQAHDAGVQVLAVDCHVEEDSITAGKAVNVCL